MYACMNTEHICYIYIHVCVYDYRAYMLQIDMHVCMYEYRSYMFIHRYACMHVCIHRHTYKCTLPCPFRDLYVEVLDLHTDIVVYIHTSTHIHKHLYIIPYI